MNTNPTAYQRAKTKAFNLVKDEVLDKYRLYILRDLNKFKTNWSYAKRHLNYFKEYLKYYKPYLPKDEHETLSKDYNKKWYQVQRLSPQYILQHRKASLKYQKVRTKKYKSQIEKEAQSFDNFSKKLIEGKIKL